MTISAIITSHANPDGLLNMADQLAKQQFQPSEVITLVSGEGYNLFSEFSGLPVHHEPNKNDVGHDKRAKGLSLATGDYVAFFNDDDRYSSKYLAKLAAKAEETGADIVACDFASHLVDGNIITTEPIIGRITSGNFIARRELAQQVGYNHRHYEADGQFIEDLTKAGATFARVPEVLYVHQ